MGEQDRSQAQDTSDDLSEAPVPDVERMARCTCTWRTEGSLLELWGPPAGILSVSRWLRAPTDDVVVLAGQPRGGGAPGPGTLALEVDDAAGEADQVVIQVADGRCTFTGARAALEAVAEAVEAVGVYALDLRWAPVERRQLLVPVGTGRPPVESSDDADGTALLAAGSPSLVVASAYPLDP